MRCLNENSAPYKYYGGKGITICEQWGKFENFLADMGERPKGSTLDRIDNNKNYNKENCRWATPKQQANNRSSNTYLEFDGQRMTIEQWAEKIGISSTTIWMRLNDGKWSVERALTTPLQIQNHRKRYSMARSA